MGPQRSPLSRVVVVVVVVVIVDICAIAIAGFGSSLQWCRQQRHLVNGNVNQNRRRAAARSGEWAQHFSNASCCFCDRPRDVAISGRGSRSHVCMSLTGSLSRNRRSDPIPTRDTPLMNHKIILFLFTFTLTPLLRVTGCACPIRRQAPRLDESIVQGMFTRPAYISVRLHDGRHAYLLQ